MKNSEYVRALEIAKKYLRTRKASSYQEPPHSTNFICVALDEVKVDVPDLYYEVQQLKRIIHRRLGNAHCVSHWLFKRGYLDKISYNSTLFIQQQIQAYRHRWVDSLIQEFSN